MSPDRDAVWRLLLATRAAVDRGEPADLLRDAPLDPAARDLAEIFLPLALAPRAHGFVTAVLGQTLDGYIATHAGDSRYINGDGGLFHLHRLRALSDAVLVGASTALIDEPRLTTRHVAGPNPVRVVIDPRARLPALHPLLRDDLADTLLLRRGLPGEPARQLGPRAWSVPVPATGDELPPAAIVAVLRQRGLTRLMVEGGGDTVSRFLAAHALDRVHLLVAPFLLGAGRPALRVTPVERVADAPRLESRSYRLDGDTLIELRLARAASVSPARGAPR